ncbi:hypothetical protein SJI00_12845 [Pseudomonas sp. RP23018S]|nr:hypothetical protein [Pseudomonas sp. RP23018S]MDZ5603664.1 hypothetical protein [Pseudomonas sp. RP23018S]
MLRTRRAMAKAMVRGRRSSVMVMLQFDLADGFMQMTGKRWFSKRH